MNSTKWLPVLFVILLTATIAFIIYRAFAFASPSPLGRWLVWVGSVILALLMLPSFLVVAALLADSRKIPPAQAGGPVRVSPSADGEQVQREYGLIGRGLESSFLAQDPATKRCMESDSQLRQQTDAKKG